MTPSFTCLLVCGSYSTVSSNQIILDEARIFLEKNKNVTVFQAEGLAEATSFSPTQEDQAPPSIVSLREQLATADAVIIAAPEYAGGLAG